MNSLKADYSFLEPTWKLPTLGTPSTHVGTNDRSYSSSGQKVDPDMSNWTNTMHNSRYIPPNVNRGTYPQTTNQQPGQRSIQSGPPQSYQQQGENFIQPDPPQSYQQSGERFKQPGPPQSYQQQGEHFMQSGPPQSYQQQGENFIQPDPPQSYQQSGERFRQSAFPQSYQPQGEQFMQPGPPAHPLPQSYQQPGEHFMQHGLPPPPVQSYQQSNTQYRNNENYNDNFNFDFNANVNANNEYNMPTQPRNNGYSNEQNVNRGLNYPSPPQPLQKRIQMIDYNQQPLPSDYQPSRESTNSNSYTNHSPGSNQFEQKPKPSRKQTNDNRLDSINSNTQRQNNFNIHEYLYGLSAPDPGSYVSAYKNQRRRLQDERVNHKSVITEYKSFLQNGGFGPTFGNADHQTYEEKLDTENKRKSYSKLVREINQHKLEEQKRIQNNGGQERARAYGAPTLRRRQPELTSHLLFTPEVREFERKIKREHDANCKCSLHAKPFNSFA